MKMTNDHCAPATFQHALQQACATHGLQLHLVCAPDDAVACRVLAEYGAIFVADYTRVSVPPTCVFRSEADVEAFQQQAGFTSEVIAGVKIELQPAAMRALLCACDEAEAAGAKITPRGGSEAARRSFGDTLRLWESRFAPALAHWTECGRLDQDEARRLRLLTAHEQVAAVLELEERGLFFSRDFTKPVLRSVAAPGTSQHLSMLALDVEEFRDALVQQALQRHGWFQTVWSDLPHWTFLGLDETELPAHGLTRIEDGGQAFWVPNTAGGPLTTA